VVAKQEKRRLPLVGATGAPDTRGAGDDDLQRPAWQWVGFGGAAVLTAWLPLSALVGVLAAKLASGSGSDTAGAARAGVTIVGLHVVALALASLGGGFVVGRWGGTGVGVTAAGLAGFVAGLVAIAVAWATMGVSGWTFFILAVSLPASAAGGRQGVRARARGV
jgi:hypothetical protein